MADYQFIGLYGERPKLIPISQSNAKKVKLDLPSSFDMFNFYSSKRPGGFYDIFEGKSGIAVSKGQKVLSNAKAIAVENINRHAKTADSFREMTKSGIKKAIQRLKEFNIAIPSDYIKNLESPKPVIKKPAPKPTTKKATPKAAAKKAVVSKAKQTGKSNLKKDRELSAMNPGKRASGPGAKRAFYYEYRRNRTDQPGKKI